MYTILETTQLLLTKTITETFFFQGSIHDLNTKTIPKLFCKRIQRTTAVLKSFLKLRLVNVCAIQISL